MTAPENFGPDSAVDILRSQGYDIGDGKGGKPIPGSESVFQVKPVGARPPDKATKPVDHETAVSETETSDRLRWIIGGVLLLGGIGIFVLALVRGRAS